MSEELIWAIKNNDLNTIKQICEKDGFDINEELSNGRAALHYAADDGHEQIVAYLLSKGANVNALDRYGISPLLAAIYGNHIECVETLLQSGADKNQKTPDGMSMYDVAETEEMRNLLR